MSTAEAHCSYSDAAVMSCGAALLSLMPVAAHQLGILRHLPDPPGAVFDSDRITESRAAHPMGIPDSLLGIVSYSITLILLTSARRHAVARRLVPLKLTADASAAGFNAVRQVRDFQRICSWCSATALATIGMVYFGRKSLQRSKRAA